MKKGIMAVVMAAMALTATLPAYGRGFVVVRGGFYGPGPYWGSYWGPAYVGPYYAYPNSGEVKLDSKANDAEVFINGAYAGTVKDNHTMRLRQGDYNIEIRHAGRTEFAEKVYVTAGKTIHIKPIS